MKIRTFLFWPHLSAGVLAGVFILILSISGILLTYEHKIVDAFAKAEVVTAPSGSAMRTVDEIASIARLRSGGAMVIMLNFQNRDKAPVIVHPIGMGELHELTLNPYTGEDFTGTSASAKTFFQTIVGWHRWLAMEGSGRGVGRIMTGAANLILLFLVATGIYLWLPRVWKWALLRPKILFRRSLPAGKARDYNWHHAFSFWALIPLFIIVGSGVIISYPWANAAFYRAFGADAPKQGGPAFFVDLRKDAALGVAGADTTQFATLQDAFDAAKKTDQNWKKMNLFIHPNADVPIVRVMVHDGNGVLPEQMVTVTFDRREKRITQIQGYDDLSTVERARMWIRFVHTGEQYGIVGSTIAGLASAAAGFLVYTGLALAYRRLLEHLQKRQRRKLAR